MTKLFFGRIKRLEKCPLIRGMNLDILINENHNNDYTSIHIGDIWKIGCDILRARNIVCFHHFLSEFVCFCSNPTKFTIDSSNSSYTQSIPPPQMIKLWMEWWIQKSHHAGYIDVDYPNTFLSLDNLITIETFAKCDINDRYKRIGSNPAVQNYHYQYQKCLHHSYSINYFVCNIWEDLLQREREYLKFKALPNKAFQTKQYT